ncbi:MAG: outer membrane protein assembly factor BamE domain-containing protein [Methylovulum sp.]|jgi:outer membrane protein assembly factor BamE (lipoprotein component of BamABCDE complex)
MKKNRYLKLSRKLLAGLVCIAGFNLVGCVTDGHVFPAGEIQTIRIGDSTESDIARTFGTPWSSGISNGLKTWSYRDDRYNLFTDSERENLVIKFDKRGVVSSFTYNSTKRSK